jgi:hypothetical protein
MDPDPAPHQADANLRALAYGTDFPRLHFEPLRLLNFFDADPNQTFHSDADPASKNQKYYIQGFHIKNHNVPIPYWYSTVQFRQFHICFYYVQYGTGKVQIYFLRSTLTMHTS